MRSLSVENPMPLKGGPTLRWGILAPGVIAASFVESVLRHTDQKVTAVGSRSSERSSEFARRFGILKSYGSYEQLLSEDEIDIVYIASPHSHHYAIALTALEAGKHVLIEKPIATSAQEARQIRDAASSAGLFAMEAMHTRFHPKTRVLDQLLRNGDIGPVQMVTAEAGATYPEDLTHRIYDPDLGGGVLLDMGVYSVWFSVFALGAPVETVHCVGRLTSTGVDAQSTTLMATADGGLATASCSLSTLHSGVATVNGSNGRVVFHSRFGAPGELTFFDARNQPVAEFVDRSGLVSAGDGLCRQAVWAARHVSDELGESPMHPLSTSIATMQVLDEARLQLGVTEPLQA